MILAWFVFGKAWLGTWTDLHAFAWISEPFDAR